LLGSLGRSKTPLLASLGSLVGCQQRLHYLIPAQRFFFQELSWTTFLDYLKSAVIFGGRMAVQLALEKTLALVSIVCQSAAEG
jgi:hypothetical protein